MERVFEYASHLIALLGVLICMVTGLARVAGTYQLLGYQTMTLFIGGIALMVMACLIKLHIVSIAIRQKV